MNLANMGWIKNKNPALRNIVAENSATTATSPRLPWRRGEGEDRLAWAGSVKGDTGEGPAHLVTRLTLEGQHARGAGPRRRHGLGRHRLLGGRRQVMTKLTELRHRTGGHRAIEPLLELLHGEPALHAVQLQLWRDPLAVTSRSTETVIAGGVMRP